MVSLVAAYVLDLYLKAFPCTGLAQPTNITTTILVRAPLFYYYTYYQIRENRRHACKFKLAVSRDPVPKYLELETSKAQAS